MLIYIKDRMETLERSTCKLLREIESGTTHYDLSIDYSGRSLKARFFLQATILSPNYLLHSTTLEELVHQELASQTYYHLVTRNPDLTFLLTFTYTLLELSGYTPFDRRWLRQWIYTPRDLANQ